MNPSAIYSKSGKGVQEASGKTSLLNRGDRAVLSAIDGRATLADVAQKVGKTFDSGFQELISKLDKDGFIREASPGAAAKSAMGAKPAAARPGGKPAAKPASDDLGEDLDFSSLGAPKAAPAPSRPAAPPPKPDPGAEARAREQQSALQKAREEAENRAQAERDKQRSEAEAKIRAETETKLRAEAEAKVKAEAEAKIRADAEAKAKAVRDAAVKAAAEARAKAEAESKARQEAERKAKEEIERAKKQAEEEARKAREEAERARKEAEEAARKAREEAERKAKEEAEAMRRQMEEERKREDEERAARRKREEEEEAERRKAREEEDRRREEEERAARRKREREEDAERRREGEDSAAPSKAEAKKAKAKAPEPAPKSQSAGNLDSLMADLDSFTTREDKERKEKEEAERKAQEAAAQRAREEAQRREREDAERRKKEEARARKEEERRRKREEEDELARKREKEEARLRAEEEKRGKEADERERKAKAEEVLAAKATRGPAVAVGEDTDEVRKRMVGRRGGGAPASVIEPPSLRRKKSGWGRPVAIALVLLLLAAVGVVHVLPVPTADYERAASEAFGQKVTIGEARISLLSGLQLKFKDIRLGDDVRIATGAASPEFEALRGEKKVFSRIEVAGVKLPLDALGGALFARVKGDNFSVQRIVVRGLELAGTLPLPSPLEADLSYGDDGVLKTATVRGPDTLLARITPAKDSLEYVVTASGFPLPFLSEVTLSDFGMKGTANERGMSIAEWGGKIFGGSVSGTANVRWGNAWNVEGVLTARNINAAVFAPALLSEGKGEGTGRFTMSGAEPAKLGTGSRLEGNFTINSGVLGSFDLGRVIRTSGKEFAGRTQFNELSGQAVYDRGAVTIRNVAIGAGALNAGASVDIGQGGALSGRIVADVKSNTGRTVNATVQLGGTVKEPQVRN